MFGKKIGIDLGTTTVLVYIPKKGIIIHEPSVVAISLADAMAVGKRQRNVRTHRSIVAKRPLKDGVTLTITTGCYAIY
jgi:rod shape-determining protein MreB